MRKEFGDLQNLPQDRRMGFRQSPTTIFTITMIYPFHPKLSWGKSCFITCNLCFEPGIVQSKMAFPPIEIETLAIGEIGSASVFRRNTKSIRIK